MKTLLCILTGLGMMAALPLIASAPGVIPLEEALRKKMVDGTVKAMGGHSGGCMLVTLNNHTNAALTIQLEAGRRLNSLNDHNQDILVTREQFLVINPHQSADLLAWGYCCQLHNSSPSADAGYSLGTMGDSSLVALAQYLNKNRMDKGAEQEAVWCVSDNEPVTAIAGSNKEKLKGLRAFVAKLKHVAEPWYTCSQKTSVDSAGRISRSIAVLSGSVHYRLNTDNYVYMKIVDSKGVMVRKLQGNKIMPQGEYDYDFDVKIQGWPRGKYKLCVCTDSQQILVKEFEI